MTYKLLTNPEAPSTNEEIEEYTMDESNPLGNALRADVELFNEDEWEAGKATNPVIRVKRTDKSRDGEIWNIFENNKLVLSLGAKRFTNKEKTFLRTAEGFNYIIKGYKDGWRSVNKFKQNIKV